MANKKNLVRKKSALARRRAGKINGLKGGYSGFRGYRKHPENKSSSFSLSVNPHKRKSARPIKYHTPDKNNIDDSDPIDIIQFEDFYQSQDSQKPTKTYLAKDNLKALDHHCINSSDNDEQILKLKPLEDVTDAVESFIQIQKVFKRSASDFGLTCTNDKHPFADNVG